MIYFLLHIFPNFGSTPFCFFIKTFNCYTRSGYKSFHFNNFFISPAPEVRYKHNIARIVSQELDRHNKISNESVFCYLIIFIKVYLSPACKSLEGNYCFALIFFLSHSNDLFLFFFTTEK